MESGDNARNSNTRSPINERIKSFPYEGKDLTSRKGNVTANIGRDTFHFALG